MTLAKYKPCRGCDKRRPIGEFPTEIRLGSRLRSEFCQLCYPHREYLGRKECRRCKVTKMWAEFGSDRNRPGHRDFYCKLCREDVDAAKAKRRGG